MPGILRVSRTRSHECSERLEPDIGELISPVLRGGGSGNAVSLLDAMKLTVLQQQNKAFIEANPEGGTQVATTLERVKHYGVSVLFPKNNTLRVCLRSFREITEFADHQANRRETDERQRIANPILKIFR